MFQTLLSSKPTPLRPTIPGGAAALLHLAIVLGAVFFTASSPPVSAPESRDTMRLELDNVVDPEISGEPSGSSGSPLPRATPIVPAPPVVPTIDAVPPAGQLRMSDRIRSNLLRDSMPESRSGQSAFTVVEVDELPEMRGDLRPDYPGQLRRAGISGRVLLEYVVLPAGRVDSASIRVIASTDPAFTTSVIRAIASAGFAPARRFGKAVSVLVRQTIRFQNR